VANLLERVRRIVVPIPSPAAGAELVIAPNTLGDWRILNLLFTFTASAVVANRQVSASITDGTTVTWRMPPPPVQAAGSAVTYQLTANVPGQALAAGILQTSCPYEGLFMRRGWSLRTLTALIDVGDQYSAISAYIEELPDGPDTHWQPSLGLYPVETDAP
jgi:hypothetical protein